MEQRDSLFRMKDVYHAETNRIIHNKAKIQLTATKIDLLKNNLSHVKSCSS